MPNFSRESLDLIACLRGLPASNSKARVRNGTTQIGSVIEALVHKHAIGQATTHDVLREHWHHIVGAPFAQRCVPDRITPDGTLLIIVQNPTLRRELAFHEPRILTALSSLPRCQHIHNIAFKAG